MNIIKFIHVLSWVIIAWFILGFILACVFNARNKHEIEWGIKKAAGPPLWLWVCTVIAIVALCTL